MRYPCHTLIQVFWYRLVGFFMLSATFNNITVISCWSDLLVEGTGMLGENHLPAISHWQTVVSSEEDLGNIYQATYSLAIVPFKYPHFITWCLISSRRLLSSVSSEQSKTNMLRKNGLYQSAWGYKGSVNKHKY
jgi:hypothetical protein